MHQGVAANVGHILAKQALLSVNVEEGERSIRLLFQKMENNKMVRVTSDCTLLWLMFILKYCKPTDSSARS